MSEAPERIKAMMRVYDDGTYAIGAYLPETPTFADDEYVEYIRADLARLPEELVERAKTLVESYHIYAAAEVELLVEILAWRDGKEGR